MAEMEKKQHLVLQEQQLWQQYATEVMRGQATLAKIGGTGYYAPGPPVMPYGMPPVNGMGPLTGFSEEGRVNPREILFGEDISMVTSSASCPCSCFL
ncbi:hypothetical protein EUGRSUZ_C04414 [Eucalyptus grandis]|uniref:Uncharacterized protein n=2 Tax=Eucalyptus grandis TaxID=71139 RepID=A0ACC3LM96_EUCGR|nr:hypothetical protein EUGRSUZ_C04414 [Eucalyptus grandis]